MTIIDPTNPAHTKALGMFERDLIIWFTTVGSDGAPHSAPVWFFYDPQPDGDRIWVSTRPDTAKVANVRRNPSVLLHLNAGGQFGDDVVIVHGTARVADEPATQWLEKHRDAYEAKYAAAVEDYGQPLDAIAATFTAVIEVTPERLVAW